MQFFLCWMSSLEFGDFLILIRDRPFPRRLLAFHIPLFFCRRGVTIPCPPSMLLIRLVEKCDHPFVLSMGVPFQGTRNTISSLRRRLLQKPHFLLNSNFKCQHLLRTMDMSLVLAFRHTFIYCPPLCDLRCKWLTCKKNYLKQVPDIPLSDNWDSERWRRE